MTAGVSRALSAIEASGLAPNGSLTKSMDTLTLKEGDSQLTKLRRMAQMRQIVEQGMKPILQNPRITPDQKAEAQSIVDGITKAVPITHHDITEFQKQSAKNPGLTLGDMAVKTAGAQSGQSTQQTQPSTAAAPQQNAAPSGTPYQHSATGPGGVKVYSPDGKSWFTRDGKPYAP